MLFAVSKEEQDIIDKFGCGNEMYNDNISDT